MPLRPRCVRTRLLAGLTIVLLAALFAVFHQENRVAWGQTTPGPTATKDCVGPDQGSTASVGDTVTCALTIDNLLGTAAVNVGQALTVNAQRSNYQFQIGTLTCTAIGTDGSGCAATAALTVIPVTCTNSNNPTPLDAACRTITVTEALTITSLTPNTITQVINFPNGAPPLTVTARNFTIVPAGTTFFVSPTPTGSDTNNCTSRASACATVNRAISVARDGDTILITPGTLTVDRTISVNKMVTIQPDGAAKVVLRATANVAPNPIFQISAQGGPGTALGGLSMRVIVQNLTLGFDKLVANPGPAFVLINDNYTEIAANVIGAEDLPISNGITLANSDHPYIHDNTIQGNSRFIFRPLLTPGVTVTGFGIVTAECLGFATRDVSDSVRIANNLFTNLWLAGVWMCSDGAGLHQITDNVFRNNYRAIALKDVTDTSVRANVLTDGRSDGIILYGTSLHNRIEENRIESHIGPDAAAIRVGWVADPLVPLDNVLARNEIVRATVGVHVFGARTTQITGNVIKLSGARTEILVTPALGYGGIGDQPYDTEITNNTLIFIGPCAASFGCALRLVATTVPVLATDNDWGLRRDADVDGVIYHQHDDPALGPVQFVPFRNQASAGLGPPTSGTPTPTATPPSGPSTSPTGNGAVTPTATATPGTGAFTSAGPSASVASAGPRTSAAASAASSSTTSPAPPSGASSRSVDTAGGITVALDAGCKVMSWPGADGVSVVDAAQLITPGSAQSGAVIWRKDGTGWRGFGPGRDGRAPLEVFTLRRGDTLNVCVPRAATWQIPPEVGGP